MSKEGVPYRRPQAAELARRLAEPRRFIKVVAGPRQVRSSTVARCAGPQTPHGQRDARVGRWGVWLLGELRRARS
jgi:hypothetical protein